MVVVSYIFKAVIVSAFSPCGLSDMLMQSGYVLIRKHWLRKALFWSGECFAPHLGHFFCDRVPQVRHLTRRADMSRRVILPTCDTFASTCPREIGNIDVSNLNFLEFYYVSGTSRFKCPMKILQGTWGSTFQLI